MNSTWIDLSYLVVIVLFICVHSSNGSFAAHFQVHENTLGCSVAFNVSERYRFYLSSGGFHLRPNLCHQLCIFTNVCIP